jgi:hypothetical protein
MKTNLAHIFFAIGCLLVVAAIWPVLLLVNRIHPFVLGLPFFLFYMLMLNVAVGVLLVIAFRKLD